MFRTTNRRLPDKCQEASGTNPEKEAPQEAALQPTDSAPRELAPATVLRALGGPRVTEGATSYSLLSSVG